MENINEIKMSLVFCPFLFHFPFPSFQFTYFYSKHFFLNLILEKIYFLIEIILEVPFFTVLVI